MAESCTGGLLGGAITSVPGASDVFPGGVIAYSDAVKEALLGVSPALLSQHGAVSAAAVEAMAHGVRDRLGVEVGVAISGIAGPTGGTSSKTIGTVWIAVIGPEHLITVHRYLFEGGRGEVRRLAVDAALGLLAGNLEEAVADIEGTSQAR